MNFVILKQCEVDVNTESRLVRNTNIKNLGSFMEKNRLSVGKGMMNGIV